MGGAMLAGWLCSATFLVVALVFVSLWWHNRPGDPLERRILQRLVVTPADEAGFSGVLREVGRGVDGHVVFSDCRTLDSNQLIAGDVVKAKRQIVTYQQVADAAR